MQTVMQFGYFSRIFWLLEGSWIRGTFLRWFPPYMLPPYPFGADSSAARKHFPKNNALNKTNDGTAV